MSKFRRGCACGHCNEHVERGGKYIPGHNIQANNPKYEDYQNLIYKLAHRYHATTGIEFDELVACANMEFITCQDNYDPAMSKFITYLHIKIQGLFLEMNRKDKAQPTAICIDDKDYKLGTDDLIEKRLTFKEMISKLSKDAQKVIKIIFKLTNVMPEPEKISSTRFVIQFACCNPDANYKDAINALKEAGLKQISESTIYSYVQNTKQIINYIKESNQINIIPNNFSHGINKHQIQNYLRDKGWSIPRIKITFDEITVALAI
ncbi:hypothetical protein LCGC14_1853900 [marine sediment metagenome]|uniref:RNA polymerase sigma-70 region 2 domain-containing protein n=1 Tax=marine sediment metagenome TaxID=412755 RepID=A0A0F9IP37_9ZZZZ